VCLTPACTTPVKLPRRCYSAEACRPGWQWRSSATPDQPHVAELLPRHRRTAPGHGGQGRGSAMGMTGHRNGTARRPARSSASAFPQVKNGAASGNRTPDLRITREPREHPERSTSTDETPHPTHRSERPARRQFVMPAVMPGGEISQVLTDGLEGRPMTIRGARSEIAGSTIDHRILVGYPDRTSSISTSVGIVCHRQVPDRPLRVVGAATEDGLPVPADWYPGGTPRSKERISTRSRGRSMPGVGLIRATARRDRRS
jgi:hypothetical protein